jgi:hypothetical protein
MYLIEDSVCLQYNLNAVIQKSVSENARNAILDHSRGGKIQIFSGENIPRPLFHYI